MEAAGEDVEARAVVDTVRVDGDMEAMERMAWTMVAMEVMTVRKKIFPEMQSI